MHRRAFGQHPRGVVLLLRSVLQGEREAEKMKESWANILVGKFDPTNWIKTMESARKTPLKKVGSLRMRRPDKEAQIGSGQNPSKKDREEGIRPEGSLEEGWKPEEDVELVPLDPN
ncbi:Leucine-rich repeat protein kinase family protein [Prunus dulcis]|uniref:Leucine-rich repeat protein kinase family protein n=1 Tax=Prunus dulcis TaxID=3755 RepID=A0A4Y1R2E8_PRUDU|nr:Leucine-rich repeat protein kinase family protein [Prunus dulcis]